MDVEEILFSAPDSRESLDDSWSDTSENYMLDAVDNDYESDDDLFDNPSQVTPDSWQLLSSSPLPTAAEIPELSHDDISITEIDHGMVESMVLPMKAGKRSPRDRCHAETYKMAHADWKQTLGHSSCRSHAGTARGWSYGRQ